MDVPKYLDRIKYTGPVEPSIDALHALHRAHILAVPFENLDIHLGRPIVLDQSLFFEKIVASRRGGFCYELNGLFAGLLREIGFKVTRLSAGVAGAEGQFGPDFDHMALKVDLKEPWLADVGFGDSFIEPIRLDDSIVTEDATGAYRIESDGQHSLMSRRSTEHGDSWRPQYRFTLAPRELADYRDMCVYQQTSPESHFTKHRICSLATDTGRITLSDLKLITTRAGIREERMLSGESEFKNILADHFGITIQV